MYEILLFARVVMSLISDSDREGARANVTQGNYALPLSQGG